MSQARPEISGTTAATSPAAAVDKAIKDNNAAIKDGDDVWLEGAEGAKIKVKAMVTRRVGAGVAFTPFHFGGHFEGKDLRSKYPAGCDPFVLGEACNTAMTYGYDSVTQMQETKCTLCRIYKA